MNLLLLIIVAVLAAVFIFIASPKKLSGAATETAGSGTDTAYCTESVSGTDSVSGNTGALLPAGSRAGYLLFLIVPAFLFVCAFVYRRRLSDIVNSAGSPENRILLPAYVIFSAAAALLLAAGVFLYLKNKSFHKLFPVYLFTAGLMFMLVIPTYAIPDAAAHFNTAYRISNDVLGYGYSQPDGNMVTRICDIPEETPEKYFISAGQYRRFLQGFSGGQDETLTQIKAESLKDGNTLLFRVLYFFPTVGILAGRLLHLNISWLYLAGRLLNLLAAVSLISFSIRITPRGKSIIAALSFLPATLQQIGSLSYDAILIPAAFVYAASVIRMMETGKAPGRKEAAALIISAVLLGATKGGIYAPLLLLAPIALKKAFDSRKTVLLTLIAVAAVVAVLLQAYTSQLQWLANVGSAGDVLITGAGRLTASAGSSAGASAGVSAMTPAGVSAGASAGVSAVTSAGGGAFGSILLSEGAAQAVTSSPEVHYSLSYILEQPAAFIAMLFRTFFTFAGFYLRSVIGSDLGWFQVSIHPLLQAVFFIVLILSLLKQKGRSRTLAPSFRIFSVVLCILSAAMIAVSMFLAYTPYGSDVVRGIQGRYFIPFLPFLLTAVSPQGEKGALKVKPYNEVLLLLLAAAELSALSIVFRM